MPENIIQIDQHMLETRLDRLVTQKVTEILNAMLDAEADEIAGASRYERSGGWKAYRADHYERRITAKAGTLELKVPKLKGALFESAVVERYRRRGGRASPPARSTTSASCCGARGCPRRPSPTNSRGCTPTSTRGARGRWNANTPTCSWTACGTGARGAARWRT